MKHPRILTENFAEITQQNQPYFGLIKMKILPPRDLFHPLLPYRSREKKLCFPLCRSCCDTQPDGDCAHTEDERALEGTWVTMEVDKALELGYKVLHVDEVWDYGSSMQYDGKDDDSGLFVKYVPALFLSAPLVTYPIFQVHKPVPSTKATSRQLACVGEDGGGEGALPGRLLGAGGSRPRPESH